MYFSVSSLGTLYFYLIAENNTSASIKSLILQLFNALEGCC